MMMRRTKNYKQFYNHRQYSSYVQQPDDVNNNINLAIIERKENNIQKLPIEILRYHILSFLFFVDHANYFRECKQFNWKESGELDFFSCNGYFYELKKRCFYCKLSDSASWEYYNNPTFRERVRNSLVVDPKEQLRVNIWPYDKNQTYPPLDLSRFNDIHTLNIDPYDFDGREALSIQKGSVLTGVDSLEIPGFFDDINPFHDVKSFTTPLAGLVGINVTLNFFGFTHLTNISICYRFCNLRDEIETLSLFFCDPGEALGYFPKIKKANLAQLPNLKDISGLSGLEQLTINNCPNLTLPTDPLFYRNLIKFSADADSAVPKDLSLLNHCGELRLETFELSSFTALVNALEYLVSLYLKSCPSLIRVTNLINLRQLFLIYCKAVEEISGLRNLVFLSIDTSPSYCSVYKGLENCHSLATIVTGSTKFDSPDHLLGILYALPHLRRVSVNEVTNLPIHKIPYLDYSYIGKNGESSCKLQGNLISGRFICVQILLNIVLNVKYLLFLKISSCSSLNTIHLLSDSRSDFIEYLVIDDCRLLRTILIQPDGDRVLIKSCPLLENIETFGHYDHFNIMKSKP